MTTMRMPQPGEKWRLRVREMHEDPCPYCGHVGGTGQGTKEANGSAVLIVRVIKYARCFGCARRLKVTGYLTRLPNGVLVGVPYTWLQPLDWSPQ